MDLRPTAYGKMMGRPMIDQYVVIDSYFCCCYSWTWAFSNLGLQAGSQSDVLKHGLNALECSHELRRRSIVEKGLGFREGHPQEKIKMQGRRAQAPEPTQHAHSAIRKMLACLVSTDIDYSKSMPQNLFKSSGSDEGRALALSAHEHRELL